MHQSIPAVPIPGSPPGISIFLKKWANFPGWGNIHVGAKPPPKCFVSSWVFDIFSHYLKSIDSFYTKLGRWAGDLLPIIFTWKMSTWQHGGDTPNNRLTETYSLGLPCTSLTLVIHVMINWHLSKQGIRWPVSRDHIAGSSLQLIAVTCFFEVNATPVLKVNRIVTFSPIQIFFCCFVLSMWWLLKLKTEGQTIYRKPHRKVAKLKLKFYLFLG